MILKKFKFSLPQQLFISLFLAFICSHFFPTFFVKLSPIGDIFIRLLKLISIPLVLVSVIMGILNLKQLKTVRSLGVKILIYSFLTTLISILLSITIGSIIDILPSFDIIKLNMGSIAHDASPSFSKIFVDIIPINILKALSESNILSVVFLGGLVGCACLSIQKQGTAFTSIVASFESVLFKLTSWILQLTPIGIFFLLTTYFSRLGSTDLSPLFNYMVAVIVALLIHAFVVLPLIVVLFGQTSPWFLLKETILALGTGFATSSSMATLPITMDRLINRASISKPLASCFISLGTTINMNGTAIYQIIAVLFSAKLFEMPLSSGTLFLIIVTTLFVSMGTAAIPGGGLMTLVIILQIAQIPEDAIGYILIVDRFLDQCRTSVNIWGNICGAKIFSKEY